MLCSRRHSQPNSSRLLVISVSPSTSIHKFPSVQPTIIGTRAPRCSASTRRRPLESIQTTQDKTCQSSWRVSRACSTRVQSPIYVDSQVSQCAANHHWYKGATLFCVNEKEALVPMMVGCT